MVAAEDLKFSTRESVQVQVLSRAPINLWIQLNSSGNKILIFNSVAHYAVCNQDTVGDNEDYSSFASVLGSH